MPYPPGSRDAIAEAMMNIARPPPYGQQPGQSMMMPRTLGGGLTAIGNAIGSMAPPPQQPPGPPTSLAPPQQPTQPPPQMPPQPPPQMPPGPPQGAPIGSGMTPQDPQGIY